MQRIMSQMRLDKTPEKQINEVQIDIFQKRTQDNDSENDSVSWKKDWRRCDKCLSRPARSKV